jgi:hypothetical protein
MVACNLLNDYEAAIVDVLHAEYGRLLGCSAVQSGRSLPTFQRCGLPPSSGIALMEAARTSETLVNFYQTTQRYNPEDSHLCTHRCENIKSYVLHADSASDINCSDDESEQEMVISDNIHAENVSAN